VHNHRDPSPLFPSRSRSPLPLPLPNVAATFRWASCRCRRLDALWVTASAVTKTVAARRNTAKSRESRRIPTPFAHAVRPRRCRRLDALWVTTSAVTKTAATRRYTAKSRESRRIPTPFAHAVQSRRCRRLSASSRHPDRAPFATRDLSPLLPRPSASQITNPIFHSGNPIFLITANAIRIRSISFPTNKISLSNRRILTNISHHTNAATRSEHRRYVKQKKNPLTPIAINHTSNAESTPAYLGVRRLAAAFPKRRHASNGLELKTRSTNTPRGFLKEVSHLFFQDAHAFDGFACLSILRNTPKSRHRHNKFHSNLRLTHKSRPDQRHPTKHFLTASQIFHTNNLLNPHHMRQQNQSPMLVHNHRMALLRHRPLCLILKPHTNRHPRTNARTPPPVLRKKISRHSNAHKPNLPSPASILKSLRRSDAQAGIAKAVDVEFVGAPSFPPLEGWGFSPLNLILMSHFRVPHPSRPWKGGSRCFMSLAEFTPPHYFKQVLFPEEQA
jgi:hypothetical protein